MRMTHEFNLRELPTRITHGTYLTYTIYNFIQVYFLHVEYSTLRCFEYKLQLLSNKLIGILPVFLSRFFLIDAGNRKKAFQKSLPFVPPVIRSSRPVVFCKKGVLTKFAKFTKKRSMLGSRF